LNYLPQSISFNSTISREYYELQERDLEDLGGQALPLIFNEQFLWNRDFSIRWDFTKNLHFNFQSATHAQIEEPYTPVNKDLYPDQYSAWKDSVWQSIKNLGTPLDYQQQTTASYQLPLNKLPIFDWLNSDVSYTANYSWTRGTELEDGTSLGNIINSRRNVNINATLNMETLYNHFPFLKKVSERFKKAIPKKTPAKTASPGKAGKTGNSGKPGDSGKAGESGKSGTADKATAQSKNSYQREITLKPDTTITVAHNKKSKRLRVTAKTKDGKLYKLKYKIIDENKILIKSKDTVGIKLSVMAKPSLENEWWYKPAQSAAHLLMMVRSINLSYRNQYQMNLPGYMPNIGDAFGQRTSGGLAPGLDFAFGTISDSYIDKALANDWLLHNDNVATPATINSSSDLQLRATLEPMRDLKIDLNASRTDTRAQRIQYMYEGKPTTHSGSFNMTTISLKGALEGMGDANNGYQSSTFDKFRSLLPEYAARVAGQYPEPGTAYAGSTIAEMNPYSADVMIPAFLSAYTSSGGSLDLFPTLARMLPNWTIRYSGLSKLTWFSNHFKSFNINHSYKSVFSIGSYASYSSWREYMGDLGFTIDQATGMLQPSSMYNVSTVSINEAFSPLIGVDATLQNDLTAKLEYRTTRVLNLSMTSVQINEARSNDIVLGAGYKIRDFNLFGAGGNRKVRKAQSRGKSKTQSTQSTQTQNRGRSGGVNHDMNLRLDISFRKQAAITRDIASGTSSASSGNSAFKLSFMADYTLSRLLTLSAYYDQQTNTPLLSSSSYPTTTRDFGLSLKFSLTR
jgi:cell surface protein SprA